MREVVKNCSLAPSSIQSKKVIGLRLFICLLVVFLLISIFTLYYKSGLPNLKNIEENRKEICIWQFSIFMIMLAFFVWYLTIKYNNGTDFTSEKLASYLSFADEH